MTFELFLEQNAGAIIAAIPATIFALGSFIASIDAMLNTRRNRKIAAIGREGTDRKIDAVHEDLKNGVGEKIAAVAVARIAPALTDVATVVVDTITQKSDEAATMAADKIKQTADDVAAALIKANAWNGVERRIGPEDRRQPKPGL